MIRPRQCPKCGSENIKEIVYGLPDPEFVESEEGKRYHFASCIVTEDDPAWHCDTCGNDWGRKQRSPQGREEAVARICAL